MLSKNLDKLVVLLLVMILLLFLYFGLYYTGLYRVMVTNATWPKISRKWMYCRIWHILKMRQSICFKPTWEQITWTMAIWTFLFGACSLIQHYWEGFTSVQSQRVQAWVLQHTININTLGYQTVHVIRLAERVSKRSKETNMTSTLDTADMKVL